MQLMSSAFSDGQLIPKRFTCDGENVSPPLIWSDPPDGTRSFVILCDDPDAPMGTWHHWAAYDIPRDRRALPEGLPAREKVEGFRQAVNDFRSPGYGGPCPPHAHRPHHYNFRVLALSVDQLRLHEESSCRHVEHQAREHLIAEATLVGLYQR